MDSDLTALHALTSLQARALEAFRRLYKRDGVPPTIGEIGAAIGLASPFNAKVQLDALVRAGLLEKVAAGSRAYRLPDDEPGDRLPFYGCTAAGEPLPAEPLAGEWVDVRAELGGADAGLVEVVGDSMVDEGIFAGDLVSIVRRPPLDGEVVVCRFPEEGATLKVFRDLGRRGLFLVPRNKAYKPRKIEAADDAHIDGVYVGLLRSKTRSLRAEVKARRRR